MDERITAVLDTYHEMIRQERSQPREAGSGDQDGTQDRRLRAVGPQTGRLLNILACGLEAPTILELGTSFGHSGIWLAEAARATGGRLITMELHAHKSKFARERAKKADLAEYIEFKVGDAVQMIADMPNGIDFVRCWSSAGDHKKTAVSRSLLTLSSVLPCRRARPSRLR